MDVLIRRGTIEDLQTVQELNKQLFELSKEHHDDSLIVSWPFSDEGKAYFTKRLTEEDSCTFIAEIDGQSVGYLCGGLCSIEIYREKISAAELGDMFVLAEYRSKGVGKHLFESFKSWAKENNAVKLRVDVYAKNTSAITFYEQCGFEGFSCCMEQNI